MMSMTKIERQAASWAAKSEHGEVPETERAEFKSWIEADVRHRGAYLKALAVQIRIAKIGKSSPTPAPCKVQYPKPIEQRRIMIVGSIAATLLLLISGRMLWQNTLFTDIVTATGTNRVVNLPDGSVLTLNTATKVHVEYTVFSRTINLLHGEALFDVAKNKLVPFKVNAGSVRVQAVGTSFSVAQTRPKTIDVLVREGKVVVKSITRDRVETAQIAANMRAAVTGNGHIEARTTSPSDVSNALIWRRGLIFFERKPLSEAATEFARYSDMKIEIMDPSASKRIVSGVFRADSPLAFATAASQALDLKIVRKTDSIQLSTRK